MPVTINIPTPLRQFAAGQSEILVEATTAGEALDQLTSTHTELRKHLFNDQNALRNFVNVYVNDEDIRHTDGPNTPVKEEPARTPVNPGCLSSYRCFPTKRSRAIAVT